MKNKISVVIPAYDASSTIEKCLTAVTDQDYTDAYEILVIDDGSKDNTADLVKKYKKVKYIFQKNAGPAAARNNGWKNSTGDIVIFTDSDCVPEKDWLTEMVKPFEKDKEIGAVGGAYGKTINNTSKLANLIGEEIKFRYRNIGKYTDAHGSYSLAVKKEILEKVKGFDESYPVATAEDWDLCYKITELGYKIYFNRKAKTGHHHPENLMKYFKTQFRHGFYRMKLYRNHKSKVGGDKYSGNAKYVVFFSGMAILSLVLGIFMKSFLIVFWLCLFGLLVLNFRLFWFFLKTKGFRFAIEEFLLQLARGFVWVFGMIKGIFCLFKIDEKKLPDNKNWDNFWNVNNDSGFTKLSWSKRRIIKILDRYLKKDMVVLDAGCGSGFFSKYFLDKGCKVYSLDYSAEALEIAKRLTKGKAQYINGDLLDKNFCKRFSRKFDLIFTDGLFEHFSDKDQKIMLNNFILMKKNNGYIATFVPNIFSIWELVRPIFMPQIKEVPFKLAGLVKLHKNCDLKILEKGGLNVLPIRFSPEILGKYFGAILFVICKKK